jgi:hypothetical protein
MSEPDSTPRRRPPTIDLTATEIETEKPAPKGENTATAGQHADAATASQARSRSNFWPHAAAAGIGGLVVAAVLFGLWQAGVVPAQNATPAATNNGTGDISAQLAKIQSELQAMPGEQALAARLATVEAQTKAVTDSLAAINRRLDDVATAAQSARERADAASAAAKTATQNADAASAAAKSATGNTVQQSDLDALSGRIAALESAIKSLSQTTAQQQASANDRAARAAVAAEALRAVVERGAPYQAELATVKSFGADQGAIASLEPFAASGVPSAASLAQELAQLTPSLTKATAAVTTSGDNSFLGRLEENAKGLVRITPVGAPGGPAGDDPASIIARLDAEAARADIGAALADIARLPQSAKTLAEPWVQKAIAREAAIAASRSIAAAALGGLANTGTQ